MKDLRVNAHFIHFHSIIVLWGVVMLKGDLVKLKSRLRDEHAFMYTDDQLRRLEAWIYLENYSPNFKINQRFMLRNEVAVVLDFKDIHKDGAGVDVIWNRFVKIMTCGGCIGWTQRNFLVKIYDDE